MYVGGLLLCVCNHLTLPHTSRLQPPSPAVSQGRARARLRHRHAPRHWHRNLLLDQKTPSHRCPPLQCSNEFGPEAAAVSCSRRLGRSGRGAERTPAHRHSQPAAAGSCTCARSLTAAVTQSLHFDSLSCQWALSSEKRRAGIGQQLEAAAAAGDVVAAAACMQARAVSHTQQELYHTHKPFAAAATAASPHTSPSTPPHPTSTSQPPPLPLSLFEHPAAPPTPSNSPSSFTPVPAPPTPQDPNSSCKRCRPVGCWPQPSVTLLQSTRARAQASRWKRSVCSARRD